MSNVELGELKHEEGHTIQSAKEYAVEGTIHVALTRMPGGIKQEITGDEAHRKYISLDGEWDVESSLTGKSKFSSFACQGSVHKVRTDDFTAKHPDRTFKTPSKFINIDSLANESNHQIYLSFWALF